MLNLHTILRDTKESLALLQAHPIPPTLLSKLQEFSRLLETETMNTITHQEMINFLHSKQSQLQISEGKSRQQLLLGSQDEEVSGEQEENAQQIGAGGQVQLFKIGQIVQILLAAFPSGKDINNTTFESKCNQEGKQNDTAQDLPEVVTHIQILKTLVQQYLNKTQRNQENGSKCSFNTDRRPPPASHSGSVRSLLTEKLQKAALEDQDPQCRASRIIIKGNLMKELRQYESKLSGKLDMAGQPYSVQANDPKLSSAEMASWASQQVRTQAKPRLHSQRTILKQMCINNPKTKQRKNKKESLGCSRCQIY